VNADVVAFIMEDDHLGALLRGQSLESLQEQPEL
jgi:hypothetical protein